MTPIDVPFIVSHTVRLSPAEVLEALREAAMAQTRGMLCSVEPTAGSVEIETRVMPNGMVEIDGAVVSITARLPERVLALLREEAKAAIPPPAVAQSN